MISDIIIFKQEFGNTHKYQITKLGTTYSFWRQILDNPWDKVGEHELDRNGSLTEQRLIDLFKSTQEYRIQEEVQNTLDRKTNSAYHLDI